MPHPELFSGVIPGTSFPASVSQRFLVLSNAGLKSNGEIVVLADVGSPEQNFIRHDYSGSGN
ncbi:hypothetical protein [Nitrosomonas sp.]|uniref:hypothetical protein n=1 Tax=Nitrosomonas sp. TaxID=42353 RepID=UPI0025DFC5ED|nr:hypothetical protein [Nitrosomonas sp.]MCC6917512.1 hypothetical protein [Nitrosomonas sp.]